MTAHRTGRPKVATSRPVEAKLSATPPAAHGRRDHRVSGRLGRQSHSRLRDPWRGRAPAAGRGSDCRSVRRPVTLGQLSAREARAWACSNACARSVEPVHPPSLARFERSSVLPSQERHSCRDPGGGPRMTPRELEAVALSETAAALRGWPPLGREPGPHGKPRVRTRRPIPVCQPFDAPPCWRLRAAVCATLWLTTIPPVAVRLYTPVGV